MFPLRGFSGVELRIPCNFQICQTNRISTRVGRNVSGTTNSSTMLDALRQCALRLTTDAEAALHDLYSLTATRLVRYAYTITRQIEDAEDAFQAALIRIARRPKSLVKADHPWAYFLKVVRNEALRIVSRRRGVKVPLPFVADSSTTHLLLENEEINRIVRAAVTELPAVQAEVVVLKVWEDMTFAEIATVLEESPNTIASRYRYALQKLSQSLPAVLPREVLYEQ